MRCMNQSLVCNLFHEFIIKEKIMQTSDKYNILLSLLLILTISINYQLVIFVT